MCQPKSKGGRRCAAHHPATLATKSVVKEMMHLNPGQIDYIFKQLRANSTSKETPDRYEYNEYFHNLLVTTEKNQSLSDDQRNKICDKINKALSYEYVPNRSIFEAEKGLLMQSSAFKFTLDKEIEEYAKRSGISSIEARKEFNRRYLNAVTPRGTDSLNYVLDAKTRLVLDQMKDSLKPIQEETPRIVRSPIDNPIIVGSGYDPEDGRLEVEVSGGSVYALHSVSEEDHERFLRYPVATFNELRGEESHQYESFEESKQDAYRIWCDKCKEFKLASGHVCQATGRTEQNVVHHNPDETYQKIRKSFLEKEGTTNIPYHPYPDPIWTIPKEDRLHSTLDASDYSLQEYPSWELDVITLTNPDKLTNKLLAGEVVTVDFGMRLPVKGLFGTKHHMMINPMDIYLVNENEIMISPSSHSNPRCDCSAYRINGRCSHLYPYANDRLNHSLKSAVVSGTDTFLRSNRLYQAYSSEAEGHYNYRSLDDINDDDLEKITAALLSDKTTGSVLIEIDEGLQNYFKFELNSAGILCNTTQNDPAGDKLVARIQSKIDATNYPQYKRMKNFLDSFTENNWELDPLERESYLAKFQKGNSFSYLKNPETFLKDYKDALSHSSEPIPFVEGSVTNGFLSTSPDEPNARGFGVEIEFDGARRSDIAQDLYDAGLASSNADQFYHQTEDYRTWKVENDCSVDGEIVSPILYDNEESWAQVRKVCEIAKKHGAKATIRTGSHVHIGTNGDKFTEKKGTYIATVANQDVIHRLSTNPATGLHRTSAYSDANYTAPFSYQDTYDLFSPSSTFPNRSSIMNLTYPDTIEFRDPDGSLDAGVIQTQVMLAAALVSAGKSGNWSTSNVDNIRMQKIGANAVREEYINGTAETEDDKILASNISLMTTLDALFPDQESKKRMLDIAVRNPWQSKPKR